MARRGPLSCGAHATGGRQPTVPPCGTAYAASHACPSSGAQLVAWQVRSLGRVLLVVVPLVGCETPAPAAQMCVPSGAAEPVRESAARITRPWPNEPTGYKVLSEGRLDSLVDKTWRILQRRTTNGSGAALVTDTTTPRAPSRLLQFTYAAGFPAGEEPAVVFYNPTTPVSETYFAFRWRPSNPWEPHPSGVNKIAFLFPETSAAGSLYIMMFSEGTNYTIQAEPTFASDTRRLPPNVTATPVALGTWHVIEWYVRYSTTPTSRDGVTKWWLDGVLQGQYSDLQMPPDAGFIEYQFAPTWGGLGGSKALTSCYWYERVRISRP